MNSNLKMIDPGPSPVRNGSDLGSRLGVVPVPDLEPGSTESSRGRRGLEMRARRMFEARIRFVGHPDFDDPTAMAEILGPMPEPAGRGKGRRKARARDVLHSSDDDLPDSRFLTREQEVHQFRKMNFLKYRAARLRDVIDPSRARAADLDRVEKLLREAGAIRDRIIRSFLGLVVSIAKKCDCASQDFSDLISEGNVALIRATERFNFGRGTRFSTYATQVIMNDFARRIPGDRRRRARFATGREGRLQALNDHRGRADAMDPEQTRHAIRSMVGCLEGRERTIIVRRFGLACDKQTLIEIGRELGISKERVRQLESRALDKLRTIAERQRRDPTDESD